MSAETGFAGQYFDGQTARARNVRVTVTADGIRINGPGGTVLAEWPADHVRMIAGRRDGETLRLRCGDTDAARLSIGDRSAIPLLERHCEQLHRSAGRLRDHWRAILFWGTGAAASVAFLLLVGVPWLAGVAARAVPPSVEAAWGLQIAELVSNAFARRFDDGAAPRFCETPAGRAALDRLTARLTASTEMPFPLTVRVLDVPVVNAFAVPGGQIVLFSQLIADAGDASEVAGVLAHEIGHVVERHPLELVFEQVGLASLLGLLIGDVSGSAIIVAGSQMLLVTAYSRDAERDADAVAVDLLNRVDIDAHATVAFFDRLATQEPSTSGVPDIFGTHPPSRERAKAIRATATGRGEAMPAADWQALRAMCDD